MKNKNISKYLGYVLILIASIMTIIIITRFEEMNISPSSAIIPVIAFYFLGFYTLWKNEK